MFIITSDNSTINTKKHFSCCLGPTSLICHLCNYLSWHIASIPPLLIFFIPSLTLLPSVFPLLISLPPSAFIKRHSLLLAKVVPQQQSSGAGATLGTDISFPLLLTSCCRVCVLICAAVSVCVCVCAGGGQRKVG